MKFLLSIALTLVTLTSMAQDGKALTVKKTFSRSTTVSIQIDAAPEVVWALLTNAENFPMWNSTVISIDGKIELGEKIKLIAAIAPDRTFKIKIKDMQPHQSMVWGDSMGKRTFTLESKNGGTYFTMYEKIGNPMFPLFANKIPDFDEAFEQYAADLKKAAEK
ncbi:MAG: SRPBCC family protein [Flavobacteriales bacterium]